AMAFKGLSFSRLSAWAFDGAHSRPEARSDQEAWRATRGPRRGEPDLYCAASVASRKSPVRRFRLAPAALPSGRARAARRAHRGGTRTRGGDITAEGGGEEAGTKKSAPQRTQRTQRRRKKHSPRRTQRTQRQRTQRRGVDFIPFSPFPFP